MKIAILIPDRSDRPLFLKNCLRMILSQTIKPEHIEIVDDEPESDECDITKRYRIGYDRLRDKGFDLIALIENDDWYASDYLETMVKGWEKVGKPELFGTSYTIYYNLKERAYLTMQHFTRSSAMSTLIKPDLNFKWCKDSEPYADIHLWHILKGIIFTPEKVICLGIKHGIGLCGGELHSTKLERYANKDPEMSYLKSLLDEVGFDFYSTLFSSKD